MLMSHTMGISLYNRQNNRFKLLLPAAQTLTRPSLIIGEYNGKVYALSEKSRIIEFEEDGSSETWQGEWPARDSISELHSFAADFRGSGKAVFINSHKTLCYVDLARRTVAAHQLPAQVSPYLLEMISPDEAVIRFTDSTHQLHVYNFSEKTLKPYFSKPMTNGFLQRSCMYYHNDRVLVGGGHDVAEVDHEGRRLHHIKVNFQNGSVGGRSGIGRMCMDNFGNIYVATIFSGIRKIMSRSLPIKYFGVAKENSNFVLSLLPDKKQNRVLVGTNQSGLYVYDTLQNLIKHFPNFPGTDTPFSVNGIIKTPANDYLLIPASGAKAFLISSDLNNFRQLPVKPDPSAKYPGFSFFGKPLYQDDDFVMMQTQGNVYSMNYENLVMKEHVVSNNYIMSGLYYKGNFIYHDNDELFFLDPSTWKTVKRVPLPNTGYVRCYTTDSTGKIYAGTNKGIFIMDAEGRVIKHMNKEHGLPDECIYAMVIDHSGYLWCSSNKGIFRVNGDGTFFQLKKEDGLQENEFNTNVAARAEDGELFFGGVNGISSFYPSDVIRPPGLPQLMINDIQVSHNEKFQDTAAWQIDEIRMAHDENYIAISFMAKGPDNPDQYIYQYRMLGFDEEWVVHEGRRTVRYFLPPGKYTFQLFASHNYVPAPFPLKEIRITVHPPFWKTWWFIAITTGLLLTSIIWAINRYNKTRYQKQLQELEHRHSLQLQREAISRDLHDNIGAYANAVLYNAGLLEDENDEQVRKTLMQSLQHASKDMLLSLRETIWAFKKTNYTYQECWVRISNFIQPLSGYYPKIHFVLNANIPEGTLNHQKAFAIVRIVQEAVNNAIKHARAGKIEVSSSVQKDHWAIEVKDNGRGFNYNEAKVNATGDGLKNMEKRAERAGILFNIQSGEGQGTRVEIISPV